MKHKTNYAKHLAVLIVMLAGGMGWISPSGKDVYAQYYCSLTCSATVPGAGSAGNQITFSATASPYYCEGSPSYSWKFGDGATATTASTSHAYTAAGTYTWTVDVTVD